MSRVALSIASLPFTTCLVVLVLVNGSFIVSSEKKLLPPPQAFDGYIYVPEGVMSACFAVTMSRSLDFNF